MKVRQGISVAAFAALIAGSMSVADAASTNPALDRCVQMFIKEVVPADHSWEIREQTIATSVRPITATRSAVSLVAKGEKNGKLFGSASCVIERSGVLVSMYVYDTKPGRAAFGRPKLLARNLDATERSRTAFADDTKPF